MKKIICFLAFFAGFATAASLSLKQALSDGLKGNLDIQKSELGSEGIDAQINSAFRSYLPQLTANGRIARLWAHDRKPIANAYNKRQGIGDFKVGLVKIA